MSRVFLSHSSRDSRQAVAVKQWLIEQEPGLTDEIYLDLDPHTGIRPGERWKEALNRASARCEAVICLLSKHWLNSRECEVEFRYAENLHKAILCARLESVPDANITSEWQRCDLFPDRGPTTEVDIADGGQPVVLDSRGLQRLLNGLRTLGIGAEHFPWPPPDDPDRAPYRGWAPLAEADAAVFFGRDAQILRGLDALHGMRSTGVESLFVVLGPSGAGKSSFLRAGLLPRLRRDDRQFLPMPIVRPERAALTGELGLAHAIYRLRAGQGLRGPVPGEIKSACRPEHVDRLRSWLAEARAAARERLLDVPAEQPAPTVVLPVDQAEELFTADAGPEAVRFLEILAALMQHESGVTPAMLVAVTIRADRYEPLQIAPQLAGLQTALFDQLKPMPPAGYIEVINGPARRDTAAGRRLSIEAALVEQLLAETADGADALPLLALTLERLYRDFGDDGDVTMADYEAMGGMARVVQTEVDNLLAADVEQRQAQLDTLHDAFIPWLATVNPDNNEPMRRLARWDDLHAESHPLIQAMVEKRLLVKDTRNGQTVVEVALESLLRQWRELAAWLRDEAQDLKDADSIERAAADWQASDRDGSWLLEGTRLHEAETLATKPGFRDRLDPTSDYLQASRRREDDRVEAEQQRQQVEIQAARDKERARALRKRSRILITVLAVFVVLTVTALTASVIAVKQRRELQIRNTELTALRLAVEARAMLSGRAGDDVRARAIQEALASQNLSPAADPGVLLQVLSSTPDVSHQVIGPGSADGSPPFAKAVAIAPDSHRVVAGYNDGILRVLDTDSGRPIGTPMRGHQGGINVAKFSPDGHRIASAGVDRTVRLWHTDTGQPIGTPRPEHTATIVELVFSPDGRRVLSTSDDNTIRVWDTESGHSVGSPLYGYQMYFGNAAFSPDGRMIAAGGTDETVRLWDTETGAAIGEPLTGHKDIVNNVAFSPDGRRIISTSFDSLRVWNAETRQLVGKPHLATDLFASLAVSPNGRFFVTGGINSMQRWNIATGEPIGDPMTAHNDTTQSYTETKPLKNVGDIAITADSRFIVSGSMDRTLRFWDAANGQPIGDPLDAGSDSVASVVVSADDRRILTLNIAPDERVSAWIWPGPAAWHDDLCNKLTSNMSRTQWREWVSPDFEYREVCPDLPVAPD